MRFPSNCVVLKEVSSFKHVVVDKQRYLLTCTWPWGKAKDHRNDTDSRFSHGMSVLTPASFKIMRSGVSCQQDRQNGTGVVVAGGRSESWCCRALRVFAVLCVMSRRCVCACDNDEKLTFVHRVALSIAFPRTLVSAPFTSLQELRSWSGVHFLRCPFNRFPAYARVGTISFRWSLAALQ